MENTQLYSFSGRRTLAHLVEQPKTPSLELFISLMEIPQDAENPVLQAIRKLFSLRNFDSELGGSTVVFGRHHFFIKEGVDFRTACPYLFIHMDGLEVVHLWPKAGQSSHWLDALSK